MIPVKEDIFALIISVDKNGIFFAFHKHFQFHK